LAFEAALPSRADICPLRAFEAFKKPSRGS